MLYIDTTIIGEQYRSNLSGIPRVEHKIVEYYFKNYPETVGFVKFSNQLNQFVVLPASAIDQLLNQIEAIRLKPKDESLQATNQLKLKQRVAKLAKRLGVLPVLIKLQSDTSSLIAGLQASLPTARKQPQLLKFEPQTSDQVFILSGKWTHQQYTQALADLCRQTQLTILVHDIISILQPAFAPNQQVAKLFANYMQTVLPLASRILTTSDNNLKDIENLLKAWGAKTPVSAAFKLASSLPQVSPARPQAVAARADYIVSIGNVGNRKNHQLLVYAYRLAKERAIELPHLYIAGQIMPNFFTSGGFGSHD